MLKELRRLRSGTIEEKRIAKSIEKAQKAGHIGTYFTERGFIAYDDEEWADYKQYAKGSGRPSLTSERAKRIIAEHNAKKQTICNTCKHCVLGFDKVGESKVPNYIKECDENNKQFQEKYGCYLFERRYRQ